MNPCKVKNEKARVDVNVRTCYALQTSVKGRNTA